MHDEPDLRPNDTAASAASPDTFTEEASAERSGGQEPLPGERPAAVSQAAGSQAAGPQAAGAQTIDQGYAGSSEGGPGRGWGAPPPGYQAVPGYSAPRVPAGSQNFQGSSSYGGPQGSPGPLPRFHSPAPDVPIPWLAAVLGVIPGVGAMYNGQFAKGLAHLAIFATLVSLSGNVNGIFGIFVAGWIFYQAFEAYHTAMARRDGLPLPNAFGLNDIGERLGFGKNWPGGPGHRPQGAAGAPGQPGPAATYAASAPAPNEVVGSDQGIPPAAPGPAAHSAVPGYFPDAVAHGRATSPIPGSERTTGWAGTPGAYATQPPPGANWAGYIPPTAFAGAPDPAMAGTPYRMPVQTEPPVGPAVQNSVPYTPVVGGALPLTNVVPGSGTVAGSGLLAAGRRFPLGAVLLIFLGALFLLSNVAPGWRVSERWSLPILLGAASVWLFARRLRGLAGGSLPGLGGLGALRTGNALCAIRLPSMVLVLAIMSALQAGGWLTIGQSWPLLLITLGVLLLLERTMGRVSPPQAPAPEGPAAAAPTDVAEGARL